MAEENENVEVEETASAEAAAEAPAEAEASTDAVAEETAVEETVAEEAAVEETVAEEAAVEEAAVEEAPAEPAVQLSPKERKQAVRAKKVAKVPVRAAASPEERQAERVAERRKKATARSARRAQERVAYKAAEHERQPTPPREHVVGVKKTRQGVVVSDKADKTITVRIDVARRHRRYQKVVRTSSTVHAHDETNDAHVGDTVVVLESRPLSATKRWRLVEVVERAK